MTQDKGNVLSRACERKWWSRDRQCYSDHWVKMEVPVISLKKTAGQPPSAIPKLSLAVKSTVKPNSLT